MPKAIPPQQQIPSVAFLTYAGNKHVSSPQVQAGFLYKARTHQNYSNHGGSGNKDSYPVSATMYPIYNRPSDTKHPVKYQQQIYSQKPQILTKVKQFTPFSPTNKIPGAWRAINNNKQYYTKGSIYGDVQKEYVRFVKAIN